ECHEHHDHEETATYRYEITGIDCADCAAKLEEKIKKIEGVANVSLSCMNNSLVYDCDHDEGSRIAEEVRILVEKEEPDAVLTSKGHKHHHHKEHHEGHDHEACDCHRHIHEEDAHTENEDCGHHDETCSCHEHNEHEETATYRYEITGIDCADCAAKLEEKIRKIEGIANVSLSFMNNSLVYDCDHDEGGRIAEEVRILVEKEEPDAVLTSKGHKHHEHHDKHAEPEKPRTITADTHKYRITGLDCADCAAKLEGKLSGIEGISNVSISFVNSLLYFDCAEADEERILNDIRTVSAREEPEAVIEAITRNAPAPVQKEDRSMLYRLIAGALLFAAGMFTSGSLQTALMIFAYIVLGCDVIYKALKGIGRGQVFDEHFLMAVATLAAIYLHDFREAAGVMLFYQIGEYFQEMAVRRSRRSISELMDIRPDHAEVFRDGDWITADPEDIAIGEIIRVKPGERVSLDGVVVKGSSSLDTSSLTGESKMTDVDPDDEVLSGSVNKTGVLEIRVQKEYGDSTVARILDLVENQDTKKSREEQFITKFSRIYTPAVVFSAILTAIVVAMLGYGVKEAIERACTFLVISCPCALVISIPLSFFAGIGGLSSRGVLVKGAYMIEPVAKLKNIVMDKTGTLTSGEFSVAHISGEDPDTVLKYAACAEHFSNHPLAQGILDAYGKDIDESLLSEQTEIPGRGISVMTEGKRILAGNSRLMEDNGIELQKADETGTVIYVACDGKFEGYIVLADRLKDGALDTVRQLQKDCVRCYIVSGDKQAVVDEAAAALHTDGAFGECMPEDKVERIRELQKTGTVGFVGDGVNDAPVIMAADAGFAMGALGSDAAIEAADVVLMDDRPEKVSLAITAAKRILRVARENIWGAITVKIITLILSAFGIANMWMAIFADTGVAMLCVINSMRLLHIARK
ncbi:MAG: cadmium-translocating P-type ATPase, partial [Solobacterium sp.]|nr:cadmium-translocating P-type ATPase [Solobacterium sp.]